MESLDLHVLRTLAQWRTAGQAALLATVVRTWGSSPRPVGSLMALRDDGVVVGSVSGGCIEDDLIHRWRHAITDQAPQLSRYGVSADEAQRFGLPCGGTLELMLEFNPDAQDLASLLRRVDAAQLVSRRVSLRNGRVELSVLTQPGQLLCDDRYLTQAFGPAYRLLIIGAGQLSAYLAAMAVFNGFAVTVCDPREAHRDGWSVAATRLLTGMPDDVVTEFRPDLRSAVVALTHDPKLDDLALLAALESPAFYVGAIGSRRNNAARRERLREHFAIAPEALERLHGPIGLPIGSKTPAEIAVSAMAEIIACRNGVNLSLPPRQRSAEDSGVPDALCPRLLP